MLKYSADIRSCLVTLLILAASILHWQIGFSVPLFIAQLFLSTFAVVVVHNHTHIAFFKNRWLNRLTDYLLTFCQGCPVSFFVPLHQGNHHAFPAEDKDVSKVKGNESYCILGFILHPFRVFPRLWSYIWERKNSLHRSITHRIKIEFFILLSIELLLFSIDPLKFLYAVFIPQAFGFHIMLASNFLQHAGLPNSNPMHSSRNFTGRVFNLLYLNVGYHTAHHRKPGLHWSQLPSFHLKIVERIPKQCIESNFSFYMFFLVCNAMKG